MMPYFCSKNNVLVWANISAFLKPQCFFALHSVTNAFRKGLIDTMAGDANGLAYIRDFMCGVCQFAISKFEIKVALPMLQF